MKKLTLILCASMLLVGSAMAMENLDLDAPADKSTTFEIRKPVLVQVIMAQSFGIISSNEHRFKPFKSLMQRLQISSGPRIEDVD